MEQQSSVWLTELLAKLEDTTLATGIAGSDWAFPIIESIHVVALTLVLGTVGVVDLRLLGLASAHRPYRDVARETLPWTWVAFAIAVISGTLMFITKATEYCANTAFRTKAILLLLAGLNMLIFELVSARRSDDWAPDQSVPWPGRLAAALSLSFWVAIVFFGRRVGFTMVPG